MDVTKDNFEEAAQQIEALLPSAAFISFDEEMTGISIAGQADKMEDTPANRYSKMRKVASRYNIIQFGLAIFTKKALPSDAPEGSESYEVHVFNFFVFPTTGPINMEASGVHFNTQHGMDWNRWIREGVPYVNRESEKKLRDSILPKKADAPEEKKGSRMTLSKEADIKTTGDAVAALRSWLADEAQKDATEFEVIETNAYLRRFMHETLAAEFPDLVVESRPTPKRGTSKMFVLRLTASQKAEREEKLLSEKRLELSRKVGFRRVFTAMADAKVPVVGHAIMYDMLFALSHFESPLPETYPEYKELVQRLFPVSFDTQFLAKSQPFKFLPQAAGSEPGAKKENRFGSMALGAVYKTVEQEAQSAKSAGLPTVYTSFAPGHEKYGPDCQAFHEAGYDAYTTGYVFAHMAKKALSPELVSSLSARSTMWRSLYHFNLGGADELATNGIHVHMRGLKGKDDKYARAALAGLKATTDENSEILKDTDLEMRWIDDDNAFAIVPETYKDALTAMLEKVASTDGDAALRFSSLDEWLSAKSSADTAMDCDVKEPPQKRARTS